MIKGVEQIARRQVLIHGLRNLGGLSGVQSPLPRPLRPIADFLWVAAGPLTHMKPDRAGNMVAVKRIG